MASLGRIDRCSICHKTGGGHCMSCTTAKDSRDIPYQGMDAYTDEALIQFLADACAELDRRDSRLKITVAA